MTTKLDLEQTSFLPFNRGNRGGAEGQKHQRATASGGIRVGRVPSAARGEQIPNGIRSTALHTMYVDKRLAGVQAVQTLSRLNPHIRAKRTRSFWISVNETEEIQRSFQPYYEQTTVAEAADPQQLYELSHRLEAAQVFWASELEAFCKLFFSHKGKMTGNIITELYRWVEPGKDRFIALPEEQQDDFS
ncbi:MAG: hypothetical protein IPM54_40995 [Polyangiaceae bacterium]|nr:hypothetical protein [Polyangiaceae bacterium]